MRKGEQANDKMVKVVKGQILRDSEEVGRVFSAGIECGRCQGSEYKYSWRYTTLFLVYVGLREGRVTSPWLFNAYPVYGWCGTIGEFYGA